jgi:hypothetical protein
VTSAVVVAIVREGRRQQRGAVEDNFEAEFERARGKIAPDLKIGFPRQIFAV